MADLYGSVELNRLVLDPNLTFGVVALLALSGFLNSTA